MGQLGRIGKGINLIQKGARKLRIPQTVSKVRSGLSALRKMILGNKVAASVITVVGLTTGILALDPEAVIQTFNKITVAAEKFEVKTAFKNAEKCFGYQATPKYFASVNEPFFKCFYSADGQGGGGEANSATNSINESRLLRGPGTKPVAPNDKVIEPLPLIQYKINPNLTPQPGSRATAINRAWRLERELVELTGRGTYPWTESEIRELLTKGKVSGYTGHHIISVENGGLGAAWQGDPRNIRFVYNRGKGNEHVASLKGHRGSFRNPTNGRLIDRQAMIDYYREHPIKKE